MIVYPFFLLRMGNPPSSGVGFYSAVFRWFGGGGVSGGGSAPVVSEWISKVRRRRR